MIACIAFLVLLLNIYDLILRDILSIWTDKRLKRLRLLFNVLRDVLLAEFEHIDDVLRLRFFRAIFVDFIESLQLLLVHPLPRRGILKITIINRAYFLVSPRHRLLPWERGFVAPLRALLLLLLFLAIGLRATRAAADLLFLFAVALEHLLLAFDSAID